MEPLRPFCLRQSLKPTISVPIACRSVGHYSLFRGWKNRPTLKMFVELFWGIRGKGCFTVGENEYFLKPGQVIVLFTGQVHDVRACTHWEYRWMTLDGKMPDQVAKAFGLGNAPVTVGPCPQELFTRLSHEIEDNSPKGQLAASATAYEILCLAHPMNKSVPESSYVRECVDLIRNNYNAPEMNVNWLATRLGIHRTNLSKLFRKKMGVSPIEYLILFRVGKALKLLLGTNLSVRQIASETGFGCPSYFTNVVRKRTGLTPLEFRSHGANPQKTLKKLRPR